MFPLLSNVALACLRLGIQRFATYLSLTHIFMDAEEIIENLKATAYKFAYASKIKKELHTLDSVDMRLLKVEIKRQLKKPENSDVNRSLRYLVEALNELSFNLDFDNDNLSSVDEGYYA